MSKFLNEQGLSHLWTRINDKFVAKEVGKGLSTNDYTTDEKTKLAGIETGANKTVVDTALTSTGTNPVEGKAIFVALENKVDKVEGKGLSTNDYTTAEKQKLAGIEEGANKYVLPEATNIVLGGVKTGSNVASTDGLTPAPIIGGIVYYKDTDTTYEAATASKAGLMSPADYSKLAAFGEASSYALKSDIASAYIYKGSVASVSALPTTGNTAGDVYNVEDTGKNYAWTGTAWDDLGGTFQIDAMTNEEIDAICV